MRSARIHPLVHARRLTAVLSGPVWYCIKVVVTVRILVLVLKMWSKLH